MTLSKAQALYLQIIKDLHKSWQPHDGQKEILQALGKGCTEIFVQCGRKFGKSEIATYLLWRHALLNPGSACYYLAPQRKQAKEIIWASQRIQTFVDTKYIKSTDNQDLRIHLSNGSFIRVDGSDNYEAYRGITPDIVVYDEFKDFKPEFHEGMAPNLAVKEAPLIVIGTPPRLNAKNYKQYIELANEARSESNGFWIKQSSYANPHISTSWLDREKKKLIARGEEDVWEREYMANIVPGGKSAVFPMYHTEDVMRKHKPLLKEITKLWKKHDFYVTVRPSTIGEFCILFSAIHKYNKKISILDEIYFDNTKSTSVRQIYPQIVAKCRELLPFLPIDKWFRLSSSTAPWFSEEILTEYDSFFPLSEISKLEIDETKISLLKDIFYNNCLEISDRCERLDWAIINYIKDKGNKLPKERHAPVVALKLLLEAGFYSTVQVLEFIKKREPVQVDRYLRYEDRELYEGKEEEDWTKKF